MQRANFLTTIFFAFVLLFVAKNVHAAAIPTPTIDGGSGTHSERDALNLRAGPQPHASFPTLNPEAPLPEPLGALTTVDGAVIPRITTAAVVPSPIITTAAVVPVSRITTGAVVPATTIAAAIADASTTNDFGIPVPATTSDAVARALPCPSHRLVCA
ncbi:unnamed protein product [Peniophora sp. CBMAI 1063]|nr:unnamed protein product [Peniophora sp. CBMAI 1063]